MNYSVVRLYKNHLGTDPFDFYKRMILLSEIFISGLDCISFIQASGFDSYKRRILSSVILISGLYRISFV